MTQENWEVGLTDAARKLRNLLRDVDSSSAPIWTGAQLQSAIYRYVEIFLPMLAAHLKSKGRIDLNGFVNKKISKIVELASTELMLLYKTAKECQIIEDNPTENSEEKCRLTAFISSGEAHAMLPLPPLDVAFCWVLHRLSPLAYNRDCVALFGTCLPAGGNENQDVPLSGLDFVSARNVDEPKSILARVQWACFANAVRSTEKKRWFLSRCCRKEYQTYLPAYLWPRYHDGKKLQSAQFDVNLFLVSRWNNLLSYSISAAAQRQKQFLYNVSLPYFDTEIAIERGAQRYKKFLMLMRDYKGLYFFPMYDIDLLWHAHILRSTEGYAEDTRQFVGRFVNHEEDDNRKADGKLQNGFKRTVLLWKETFEEDYEDNDTNYKRKIPKRFSRVLNILRSDVIREDQSLSFLSLDNGVCSKCAKKLYTDMELDCSTKFLRFLLLGRESIVKEAATATQD